MPDKFLAMDNIISLCKNSSKAIAEQQRQLDDFLRVSDGDAEGIIPPICASCMNWAEADPKAENGVFATDCPQAIPGEPGAQHGKRPVVGKQDTDSVFR